LIDSKHIAIAGRRTPNAAWLALAAAAFALPAPRAQAEAASGAAGADGTAAAAADEGPRDPIITTWSKEPPREPSTHAEAMGPKDEQSEAPLSPDSVSLYGPPAPKAKHGKLADVAWPEAPAAVPPALETAVNIVTRNYPSAKSGRAALRAAASDVKAAKWLRFPSISGNVAYLDSDNKADPQLLVEQPIWSGGRIGSNIRRAKASEDASSADYVATVEQLAVTTTQTYFEIARLTRREQLLADSVKEHLRLVETMERRVEQEVSPLADLELARSRAAQIEQDYTTTRSQRETALRVMAELVADPAYDLGPLPAYNPDTELPNSEALEDQAAAFDPNLRRLVAEADVARADFDARKAALLPQLNAQYSYDDIFGSRVGVVVRAQTTGGLSQVSQINSARLRIQSSLEARREAEQKLRRDVASDLIEFESAKARASISTRASETAARVSESYVRQFIAGRRSWLDVMNALREAVNAQIGKADAEASVMSTAVQLLLRSGRWRPQFDIPEQTPFDDSAR
jgi:adhesin transport system outer membrane protein